MEDIIAWIAGIVFFGISFAIGTLISEEHFEDIVKREKALVQLPAITGKKLYEDRPVKYSSLVSGNVVIAPDFAKLVMANIASIFGMRISVAESMVDRARREAVLRMKEKAGDVDVIFNTCITTSRIGQGGEKLSSVEAMAYGTAVKFL